MPPSSTNAQPRKDDWVTSAICLFRVLFAPQFEKGQVVSQLKSPPPASYIEISIAIELLEPQPMLNTWIASAKKLELPRTFSILTRSFFTMDARLVRPPRLAHDSGMNTRLNLGGLRVR